MKILPLRCTERMRVPGGCHKVSDKSVADGLKFKVQLNLLLSKNDASIP